MPRPSTSGRTTRTTALNLYTIRGEDQSSSRTVFGGGVPADSSTATAGEFTSRLDVGRCRARGLRLRELWLLELVEVEVDAVLVLDVVAVMREIRGVERERCVRSVVNLDVGLVRGGLCRIAEHALDHRHDLRGGEHRRVRMEEALEVAREVAGALVAVGGRLLQRVHHDLFELRRDPLAQLRGRRDVRLARHIEELVQILLEIEHLPRQHLVQHDARREDVRAVVDLVAPGLLGAHVVVLALDHADRGLARLHRRFRDAEVDELDLARVGHEHVLR